MTLQERLDRDTAIALGFLIATSDRWNQDRKDEEPKR